jgi:co-chaperonin GroES (HSP10)
MNSQKEAIYISTELSKVGIPADQSEVPVIFLDDRVLLEYIPPPELIEETSLLRPTSAKEQFSKGIVRSLGTGIYKEGVLKEYDLRLGQTVGYFDHHAIEWRVGEQKKRHDLVRASDVFAIL